MTAVVEYYMDDDGALAQVTLTVARTKVAELQRELDEQALLPDEMRTGRRGDNITNQRYRTASQLASWKARLHRMSGGTEGAPLFRSLEHV